MKKILILGGSGFLGEALGNSLSKDYEIRSFARYFFKELSPEIEVFRGEFDSTYSLLKALEGVDIVIHLISKTYPSLPNNTAHFEVDHNLKGTVNLLELMAEQGVKKICYASSGGAVYGKSIRKHYEFHNTFPSCPYGLGKVLIENTIKYYAEKCGFDYQIWRITNPYGNLNKSNISQGVIEVFFNNIKAGKPIELWGDGTVVRDFIYIDDMTSAISMLLQNNIWNATINISTGKGHSLLRLIDYMQKIVPVPIQIEYKKCKLTGPNISIVSPAKLESLTGWEAQHSLKEGLIKTWSAVK